MKEIEFDEGADLQTVVRALFYDEKDPTSANYSRKLERPRISWWRIALSCLFPLTVVTGFGFALAYFAVKPWICVCSCLGVLALYMLLRLRAILQCIIRIYQRYAPAGVRCKCRFEPSCSAYMLQSLDKYGVRKGLKIGIGRINRCKPGNGGFDPLK